MTDTRPKAEHESTARSAGFPSGRGRTVRKLSFETEMAVGLVRRATRLNLAELEALALRSSELGAAGHPPKPGLVIVKRWAGMGKDTEWLVVLGERSARQLLGDSQFDAAGCSNHAAPQHRLPTLRRGGTSSSATHPHHLPAIRCPRSSAL